MRASDPIIVRIPVDGSGIAPAMIGVSGVDSYAQPWINRYWLSGEERDS